MYGGFEVQRVQQHPDDETLPAWALSLLMPREGLGDGMHHASPAGTPRDDARYWSWTRIEVLANDRQAGVLVVRWPSGDTWAAPYADAADMFVRWQDVQDRPPFVEPPRS